MEVIIVNTLTNEDHSTVEGVITVNTLTKGSQYYRRGDHSQHIDCRGSGDSRLSIQGGRDSKITFIVRPPNYKLHFLHLHTLK